MNSNIFNFLKEYSTAPFAVDRLIVSVFLRLHNKTVCHNELLSKHVISGDSEEYKRLLVFERLIKQETDDFNFEDLIALFEFVVSPADKVINGAVYTPQFIREYIVEHLFTRNAKPIGDMYCADISCGCGGFLLSMAKQIRQRTGRSFADIYRQNIFGLDITSYSIVRSKLLLSLFALFNGEDASFHFNLKVGNALSFCWKANFALIDENGGFDLIAGNPPYVASRNMDEESRELMADWTVASTGHPDLYIPFFQIGYENLSEIGELGYITVNTFMKSINGRALRDYFSTNRIGVRIVNFGGEQLFKGRNTYTCLFFVERSGGDIDYLRITSKSLGDISSEQFYRFSYNNLNNKDGWNLVNNKKDETFIKRIEQTGLPFKSLYTTKNGIATLKNDVYKFTPHGSDEHHYFFHDNGREVAVEKSICKKIVNANRLRSVADLLAREEQIIFPYNVDQGVIKIIPENIFQEKYRKTYSYLKGKKTILRMRDKGNGNYEEWYAYGRRQSMDVNLCKLFFPHICERPTFVLSEDRDLLFYNGVAVVSNNKEDLLVLKCLLESDMFFEYIKMTTKDYASGYISMSRNFIKNFGIYQMTLEEKTELLNSDNPNKLIRKWYEVLL